MKKRMKIFLPLMLLVMAMAFLMTACGDGSSKDKDDEDDTPAYERPIESYVNAINKGSGKELKKCFCEAEVKYREENGGEDCFDDQAEDLKSSFESRYGEDAKITYKVKDKEKLDKDKLEDLSSQLQRRTDNDDIKVTEGYKIKTEFTIKSKGDSSTEKETENETLYIGKVDGKWILVDF